MGSDGASWSAGTGTSRLGVDSTGGIQDGSTGMGGTDSLRPGEDTGRSRVARGGAGTGTLSSLSGTMSVEVERASFLSPMSTDSGNEGGDRSHVLGEGVNWGSESVLLSTGASTGTPRALHGYSGIGSSNLGRVGNLPTNSGTPDSSSSPAVRNR